MYPFHIKKRFVIWGLITISIMCVKEMEIAKSESKRNRNPILTDSSRGRAITMIASSISGMDAIANLHSPQYKAACWIINENAIQLDPLTNSSALVQRYVLAVLYYSTQGWA